MEAGIRSSVFSSRCLRGIRALTTACLLLAATTASAAHISAKIEGVEGALKEAILASIEVAQYGDREVTAAQARRLFDRAENQARSALEPYGYFNVVVSGELQEQGDNYVAMLRVDAGKPVKVTALVLTLDGDADGQSAVRKAVAAFSPALHQTLDQAAYERSKSAIQAALVGSGYLDAQLVTHQVEVTRGTNAAEITLAWKTGPRYRFGPISFEGGQFPDDFMLRYVPWTDGSFYTQDALLGFQQRLIDADYFSISQVQPDIENARDGTVPIKVLLAPAKRTIYTGGVFVGTDTGPGVRGGVERRWINQRGHKMKVDTIVATQLKTAAVQYQIPLAGPDNHSLNFGATYRDEDTDSSTSRTFGLAATDSRLWRGWTRNMGLKFLTGNFEVANIQGDTTMLYPEVTFARKNADDPMFVRRGYSLTLSGRAAYSGVLADTSFTQISADA